MNTEMRKPIRFLALAIALCGTFALTACQPSGQSADGAVTAEEQAAPPPAEPSPTEPSDINGGGSTAPAADAANTAPPTDATVPPPADAGAMPPASDADKAGAEEPKPADEIQKPEENK